MSTKEKSQPAITLYRGFPKTAKFTSSPFVTKLEVRLRLGQVPHTVDVGTPLKAPRGKIPYVAIASDGADEKAAQPTMLGDSALIADRLVRDGVLEDLNAGLSPVEKARDLALRGLLEDKLYWYFVSVFPTELQPLLP